MYFSLVADSRSPALICCHCSFGHKGKSKAASSGTKRSVDIFVAYHQDAHRAASGVWHSGIQSGNCGAGIAGLGNLQSAWGNHLYCTTGTRSLLPGSPGHRWKVCGKEMDEDQRSSSDTEDLLQTLKSGNKSSSTTFGHKGLSGVLVVCSCYIITIHSIYLHYLM